MLASTLLLALVASANALPALFRRQGSVCPSPGGDAPFDLSCDQLEGNRYCPTGITGAPGGIVLLVHGTGSTGPETWDTSPYVQILPKLDPTFDVCYIDLPERSLSDAQTSAELVAYNIMQLAPQSSTGLVNVIAHSQGAGLNTQWALNYWPSTRQQVAGFVALAGDFRGTAEGPFLCAALDVAQGGCPTGVLQQNVGSVYLEAQAFRGNTALVPTTSLRTAFDEIIQPQVGNNPTSELPNAFNIALQDEAICGPTYVTDHFGMTVTPAAFALAYDALRNGGTASADRFDKANCLLLVGNDLISDSILSRFDDVPGLLRQAAFDAIAVLADQPRVMEEPPLKDYVCNGQFGMPASCSEAPLSIAANSSASASSSIDPSAEPSVISEALSSSSDLIGAGITDTPQPTITAVGDAPMPTDRTFGAVDITTTPLGDATVQPAQPTPTEVAGQQETALPEMTPGPGIGEQVDEPLGFQPEARPAVDAQSEQPQGEGGVEVVTVTA